MNVAKEFQVKPGRKVHLAGQDTACTGKFKDKRKVAGQLEELRERLDHLQYLLYAESRRSVLIVLQAMDTAGKDGTIRHVMAGLNPQGCRVTAFKAPTHEELAHDFLWRIHRAVPGKGEIGIFNRSHYEDVLVVRVHDLVPRDVWSKRYDQINTFEEYLTANGVHIVKFFLHISRKEQLKRLRARLEDPDRLWKFSESDLPERKRWDDYMAAYEDAMTRCSTKHSPWYIIPADHKWFRNLAVARILVETMEGLDMRFPKPTIDAAKILKDLK